MRRDPVLDGQGDERHDGAAKDQHADEGNAEAGSEHHPGDNRPGDSRKLEGAGHDRVVAPSQMIWRQVVGDRRDGGLEQRLTQREDSAAADDERCCCSAAGT